MNHENTLLLVPVAAAVQHFMPVQGHFEMHIWTNLLDMAGPSQGFLKSAGILLFRWWAAAVGMRVADPFPQWAAVLLPALCVVTFVVGKFLEARQWDAFLPVGIGLGLSLVAAMYRDDSASSESVVATPGAAPTLN